MNKEIKCNEEILNAKNISQNKESVSFTLNEKKYKFSLVKEIDGKIILEDENGKRVEIPFNHETFIINGQDILVRSARDARKRKKGRANIEGSMTSPMPGKILKIMKMVGDSVELGDTILVMEAMKMEHAIKASKKGIIKKILFSENDLVDGGVDLVELQ